ncbi:MAG: hypothetical protein DRQ60_00255 [Gammaproteobacteria bacterium]|nr:MAG: hypothetical protein DRQ54_00445 [Gammaproteobacteria bacterium]RLA14787.1 MAG: hypothetical protein DRQ52_03380 [Gammaproteobacteria bacterium]RLA18170.1 MAG: hypothetical protein DRQ60_00255 [Gammaproteobacteria bacterium]
MLWILQVLKHPTVRRIRQSFLHEVTPHENERGSKFKNWFDNALGYDADVLQFLRQEVVFFQSIRLRVVQQNGASEIDSELL